MFIALGSFNDFWNLTQQVMRHDAPKRICSNRAFTDQFVPVEMRAELRFRIVQMQTLEAMEPDGVAEFLNYTVEIVDQVISCGPDVRRVEADSNARRQ